MAFKEAYTNEVNQQNQGIGNVTQGVKSAITLALGTTGFGGGLGDGIIAEGAKHVLANRIGGIGGNVMLAAMKQKTESAQANIKTEQLFSNKEISSTIDSTLGDNPINNSAIKKLNTVFNVLSKAREDGLIKNGQIKSSMGDIDESSELGQKVIKELSKEK